ncbi:insulin receptor substrate 1 [Agrilus planipennis]|uniref:Insulin receptor substrate 1 n=1 Tax=Agrilus planipennis TaxID=224129 RepID=A0A1W4WNP8_AGRPL|nr:insulin receptor substrate 1 [Agrilus planipennis]
MGRSSSIGAGELWMETEDANIAQNIHQTVYHSMTTSSNSKEELGPKSRNRSSSATESSKSITRRQTTPGSIKHHNIPSSNAGGIRERCDSMPSRPRTSSEGNHQVYPWPQQRPYHGPHRPQSFYGRDISYSPPAGSPLSPPSGACSTDSAGSSLSIDDTEHFPEIDGICSRYGHSVTPDEAIAEEDCVECSYGMQRSSPSGYVPMAPISSDDGYVDMSPKGRNNRTSPSESMSSITSGTPSTDMRFIEYPLEKVSAYFTPSEEETSSVDRPMRTYSVGSRLEVRKKTAGEIGSIPDSRVRAFSVGSKTKKTYNRVLPPHGHHIHPKPKSSSAPLLSNSRLHNGDDPMDDLMEMDFSKPSKNAYVDMSAGSTNKATPEGYVEMKPALPDGLRLHENLRPPDESPYVDMQTGSSPPRLLSNNDYTHMSASSTNAKSANEEYVDMDPRKNNKHVLAQTDLRPSFSWSQSDYMEMNFQNKPRPFFSGSPKNLSGSPSSSSGLSMDMGFHNCPHTRSESKPSPMNTDGYVEMSIGKQNAHQRQSSLDSAKVTLDNGDYSDMSGSSKRKEKRGSKKESKKSQPISIQPSTASSQYQYPKNSSSISPVYSSLHIGRKHSTGTPPKMHLPLFSSSSGSYPSLPRQRVKKNNHKDSKDSSSSSLTTPSSSSTIFPISLNSPSSPIKPYSSTRTPETQGIIKLPSAIINIKYNPVSKGAFCSKDDYTIMDFEKCRTNNSNSKESDYVNYNPAQNSKEKERPMSDNVSNYAVMKPGASEISQQNDRKVVTKLSSPSSLTPQISSLDLSMTGNRCFRPITEPRDESNVESVSPKPGDVAPLKPPENMGISSSTTPRNSRPNSVIENDRAFSVIDDKSRPNSRPSSTSSETGSTTSTLVGSRPPSVSSSDQIRTSLDGQLHYATLDLVTAPDDESGCSSPRFLKNHAFSETSCGNVVADGSGFLYAEIDFVKSEGLKQNNLPTNAKVKH